jgi:hypothetical protein
VIYSFAAVSIQRTYRDWLSRRLYGEYVSSMRLSSVRKIQRAWRRFCDRQASARADVLGWAGLGCDVLCRAGLLCAVPCCALSCAVPCCALR